MTNIFPEVTKMYYTDRVLKKFDTPDNTLPYTLKDIKISHNDYLLEHVYNDAIEKLYKNFLFLIANAEIYKSSSPSASISALHIDNNFGGTFESILNNPTGTAKLSSVHEVFLSKTVNSSENLHFIFGKDNSYIFKTDDFNTTLTTLTGLISGNQIEFNRDFEYTDVVSVDRVDDFLFVLDRGSDTLFKLDIAGLIYKDPAIQRRDLNDKIHPGRYIVKTMGGKGKFSRKNKLNDPRCIKAYGRELYVLDNGNLSIKVFDTNFNYLRDYVDKELFLPQDGDQPVSLTVSRRSNLSTNPKIFVLTKNGKIVTLDTDFKNKQVFTPYNTYSSKLDSVYREQSNFKKIVESKREKNVIYICTNKRIIKFYKTNLNIPIGVFNFNLNESDAENLESINSFDVALLSSAAANDYADYFSVFTSKDKTGETQLSFYIDQTISQRLYHPNFYTNCYILNDIKIKTQELVNSITFNKTTEKLVYNHSAFFENICRKVYSYYDDNRIPTLSTVIDSTFDLPDSFNVDNNFYIGLNEPLITDVINRPLIKLYEQQVDLFNIIKEEYTNSYPPAHIPEVIPSKGTKDKYQTIKFNDIPDSNITHTITSFGFKEYTIVRDTTASKTSFEIYQTLGANSIAEDFKNIINNSTNSTDFITFDNKQTLTFTSGISSITFTVKSNSKFNTGDDKIINTFIINPSANAIIDQTHLQRTLKVTAAPPRYQFRLSFDKIQVLEGETLTVTIHKDDYISTAPEGDSYCYLKLTHLQTDDTDFTTDISDFITSTGKKVDFDFNPEENAKTFSFTLSADPDQDLVEKFQLELLTPSDNAVLGNYKSQSISVGNYVDLNFTVDSTYSNYADFDSLKSVSGINMWDYVKENATYIQSKDINYFNINLTIPSDIVVYSTSVDNGAIYFEPDVNIPFPKGATLNIINQGVISGKGGNGGQGVIYLGGSLYGNQWASTSEFTTNTTTLKEENAYITLVDTTLAPGQSGGPAIKVGGSYFVGGLQITNSGYIYGGSGGGGAGQVVILDSDDNDLILPSISATSGGGGGAGYRPGTSTFSGAGSGGNIYSSLNYAAAPFVQAGNNGTQTTGGAGGDIDLSLAVSYSNPSVSYSYDNLDRHTIMRGASGGGLGLSGQGFDHPGIESYGPDVILEDLSIEINNGTAAAQWAKRYPGGQAGYIVTGGINWSTKESDILSGTFIGR